MIKNFLSKFLEKHLSDENFSNENAKNISDNVPLTDKEIGRLGEQAALKFLWNKGYRIIAKNIRMKGGEIDILAIKNGILCFVEVKTRKFISPDTPEDTLDRRKRKAIKIAALRFLRHHNLENYPSRVDLVNVLEEKDNKLTCTHLENVISLN